MGLLKLVIFVDQPVYYSGQNISGRLIVEVSKPMSMRDDIKDCELAEGEHVFVFNCQLPTNLPGSFEGTYGNVRYSVKATIHRPWKFNYDAVQPITVVSICDLNLNPFAATPVAEQASKTFWGHSKPLLMSVDLPVRGFVPGQSIPIKVFLNNESGVQITSLYVTLKQNVTFQATTKSRCVNNNVWRKAFPLPEGPECMEVPMSLKLPAVPPSYLEFCRIIDIKYQLHVTARASGWYHRNLKIRTELLVGNIPLMNYQRPIPAPQLLHGFVDHENPSYSQTPAYAPPADNCLVPPKTIYEDLPPPTYERAMGLENSEKDKPEKNHDTNDKVDGFVPLYPVYTFADTKD